MAEELLFAGEVIAGNDETLAGFRLNNLEVLNWGTFHQKSWSLPIYGRNALLTGDIGSGKSTLVDALTCLLVPHYKIVFNKAAGAESKERSLLSYIKGVYKNERMEMTNTSKKVFLRPAEDTYSVILGNFYNSGYDEHVSLAQVFWTKDGKPEKLLIAGEQPMSIVQHFSGFSDITGLKRKLRQMPGLILFDDNFSRYSEHFRHRFGMNSDKAVDLFYQTVSMKAVSSLTEFVREQMLERTDIKEQTDILLKRFDDLTKAHQAVVHAREQYHILKELTESAVDYGNTIREIENIEEMLRVVPSWFAGKKEQLLAIAIDDTGRDLDIGEQVLKGLQEKLASLHNQAFGLKQDIENSGGKRLEQIKEEIARREKAKQDKKEEWDQYEKLTRQCGLCSAKDEQAFFTNRQQAQQLTEGCNNLEISLRDERDKNVILLRKQENELETEQEELRSLQERKTQIPGWLIDVRKQLCSDLQIEEEDLPFAGELLKVNERQTEWEGAVERMLHDFGVSMLVPGEHYSSVRRYVNSNVVRSAEGKGRKLDYYEADIDRKDSYRKQLEEDSIVWKLDIKQDTPFHPWLETYLHRHYGDCLCVEVDELPHIHFGITREGLVKSGKIRHSKDDRRNIHDRRFYVLGWSNQEKIRTLEEAIAALYSGISEIKKAIRLVEDRQKENRQLREALGFLLHVKDYSLINWQHEVEEIYRLEMEWNELMSNNDLLRTLQQKLREVEQAVTETKEQESAKNQDIGRLKEKIQQFEQQRAGCLAISEQIHEEQRQKHFPLIEQHLTDKNFRLSNIDTRHEQFRKLFEGDTGELKKLRYKQTRLTTQIQSKMRDIKEHSKAEYSELGIDIEARGEYIDKFHRLANEDLKRHEERFKEELNKHTINSIAVFDSQLEKHEKDIRQKIRQINRHLREIVYDSVRGTYIVILIDISTHKEIRQFREDLKNCYMHALAGSNELYTEEKYEQVKKILDRLGSADSTDKEWAGTVTDVRQWFDFNASERYEADDSEKEFIEGSGGKSGGQKEKLAYTILASALAYQFGLQFGENRSRSFRFVVIDEAFGRGSDESTRYGLELFKKLGLQLLIVTPLQKLHVIDPHVSSFHFVRNRDGNYSEVSTLSKKEYEEEKKRRNL